MVKKMNGLSLFAGGGIGEMMLNKLNINIVVANEINKPRAKAYSFWHPKSKMINGDIKEKDTKEQIIRECKKSKVKFIICTPPCQGASLIGKNKTTKQMSEDRRNYLIFDAFEIFDKINPDFILIENVPRYQEVLLKFNNSTIKVTDLLISKYSKNYNIKIDLLDSQNFEVPQSRKRLIIRMWKKKLIWNEPKESQKTVSVKDAIGSLPSLESGEKSKIKNHYSRVHSKDHILFMKNTPTGKSAFENEVYYPKNKKGERLKGFSATYKRINWDKPAPTITMRNDAISSQSNVHPGRKLKSGEYSDARTLTLRELFILSSINADIDLPNDVSDTQIRHMIGESVPPLMVKKICEGIINNE
jgi:DNA (cytosine-5)-methyltransferase 1